MKKAPAILLALMLSACASQVSKPAPQSYRLAGDNSLVNITGEATYKPGLIGHDTDIKIMFDNVVMISGPLGRDFNGEFSGDQFRDRPTSASCTARHIARAVEVRCAVFLGNERIANLTF